MTTDLDRCRDAYVAGALSIAKLERAVAHVLRGGYLGPRFEFRSRVMDRVRLERVCREKGHDLYEFYAAGSSTPRVFCARCGRGDKAPFLSVEEALSHSRVRATF